MVHGLDEIIGNIETPPSLFHIISMASVDLLEFG